ncbi:MAG: hypothetical protein ABIH28_00890 [archaeon]
MFNKREIAIIVILSVIIGFIVSIVSNFPASTATNFPTSKILGYSVLSIFAIILINNLVKKIAGHYFESDVKISLWEVKRYGWRPENRFRFPLQAGIIFPIILKLITFGKFNWLACLTFDVDAKVSRAARRHDIYTFSELSEYHLGVIAAWGIIANLFFAFVAYLIGLPQEMNFVNLSLYYVFFNMLPFSDLDGNKIFFGSMILWSFLAAIVLLGIFFSIFVI